MQIAFLGLGAMGSRMAARLLAAGHTVTVWNRSEGSASELVEQGARVAATPAEAATAAEVAIAMVRDDEASHRVWLAEDGALATLRGGAVGIESSTLSPAWTQELAILFAARRADFLASPVVGSRPQAEAGALIHLVGGDAAVLDRVRTVLEATGGAIFHMGSPRDAAAMKLVVNGLFGIQVAALAELLAAARVMGLDPARAAAVLGETPALSPAARGALQGIMAGAFSPAFPVELVEKDFSYLADAATAGAPLIQAARGVFQRAVAAGLGDENLTAIAKLYSA